MNRLNYSHLYYFYIVAKEGSITDASCRLFVSQPTISDQLKMLEEYFSCKLFERRNRGLHLTKEGEIALEYAEEIFKKGDQLSARLIHGIKSPKKSIDIGISSNAAQNYLYKFISPLLHQKELMVNIKRGERTTLLMELQSENIDMVFCEHEEYISGVIDSYKIGQNRFFVVGAPSFEHLKSNFPQSLTNAPLYHYLVASYTRYEIDSFFQKNEIVPQIVGETDDMDFMEYITAQGIAVTILPEDIIERMKINQKITILGQLSENTQSIWAIVRHEYKGTGLELIRGSKIIES